MRNPRFFIVTAVMIVLAPGAARSEPWYPRGTTIGAAWTSAPQVTSEQAIPILAALLLAPHSPGTEPELGPEALEAFKYLVGNHEQAAEEPAGQAEMRRYGGEITPDDMTIDQEEFFGGLSSAIAAGLGLSAVAPPGVCVRQVRLFELTKYRYDIGWNEVEVWGITAFGHNLQYGLNHSDLVYGVFPWGLRMSWSGAIKCALKDPSNEDELRACGAEKEWKLHVDAHAVLSSSYEHVVPGVAQASLTYAGALASGEAGQFRTNYQTRPSMDPSWLLGPSNTPMPSRTEAHQPCSSSDWRCGMGLAGIHDYYEFSQVLAWHPNIVLNASYNNVVPRSFEHYHYFGRNNGNPHALGTWDVNRFFSRFHEPFPSCN